MRRALLLSAAAMALASCTSKPPELTPLPPAGADTGIAAPRTNGTVASAPEIEPETMIQAGHPNDYSGGRLPRGAEAGGDVTLDFADTDIREIVKQVLGGILKVNYTIDPAVHGTATIETSKPMARADLLPTLETLLNQNGATLTQAGNLYRVVPSAVAVATPGLGGSSTAGTQVLTLHYASAADLQKVLTPYIGEGSHVEADSSRNALIVTGDPGARSAIIGLIRAFDVDLLAGQTYALFPVTSGDPDKVAAELQKVFQTEGDGALAGVVRVVPMDRVNAVLVISAQQRYIDAAHRLFHLVDQARAETARSWHVYYVQNGQSGDIANLLQRAFTPQNVTAQPEPSGTTAPGFGQSQFNSQSGGTGGTSGGLGSSGGGLGSSGGTSGGLGNTNGGTSGSTSGGLQGLSGQNPQGNGTQASGTQASTTETGGEGNATAATDSLSQGNDESKGTPNSIKIIANKTNNAILIYATPSEETTIEAMLHKIDIVPLQVRIDAVIAEVTLTDALQYGTQFSFKGAGLEGLLTTGSSGQTGSGLANALTGSYPGFNIARVGPSGDAQGIISALASITQVRVLSSPQVLAMDNQPAQLMVGDNVPYLTQSAQSTITAESDVVNSVSYQETGVILQVVPRVNSGGLVTLDLSAEVSDPVSTSSSAIDSPTFSERKILTRVVVQDGQTVGLAGLIQDSTSRSNSGIPFLKDVPVLGSLFSNQNNNRTRTELLVLITPHVIQDQRDARGLTEDLRQKLLNAGLVPQELPRVPLSGSPNPNAKLSR